MLTKPLIMFQPFRWTPSYLFVILLVYNHALKPIALVFFSSVNLVYILNWRWLVNWVRGRHLMYHIEILNLLAYYNLPLVGTDMFRYVWEDTRFIYHVEALVRSYLSIIYSSFSKELCVHISISLHLSPLPLKAVEENSTTISTC